MMINLLHLELLFNHHKRVNDCVHSATGEYKQWFVMVKDSQNRFDDNPIWGEGWGWALFKPDNLEQNQAENHKTDCLACHVPAKNTDWIYTDAYPALNQ